MHTRSDPQSEAFLRCCDDFKKLANEYLASHQNKSNKSILSFFTSPSTGEKISISLLESMSKVTFSIDFPYIRSTTRIAFLEKCSEFYKQLTHTYHDLLKGNHINEDLTDFGRQFSQILKRITYLTVGGDFKSSDDINLNYLDYYLDQITMGCDCYSNDIWLKSEISTLLSQYITHHPKSDTTKIAVPLLEAIENDLRGVNKHAEDSREKFDNLLNLINTFRLCLLESNEKALRSRVSLIIYRALDIDANFSMQTLPHSQKQDPSENHELIGLVKFR